MLFRVVPSICMPVGQGEAKGNAHLLHCCQALWWFPTEMDQFFSKNKRQANVCCLQGSNHSSRFQTWPAGNVQRIGYTVYPQFAFHSCTTQREAEQPGAADRGRKWRINSAAWVMWYLSCFSFFHGCVCCVLEASSTTLFHWNQQGLSRCVHTWNSPDFLPTLYWEASRRVRR